MTTLSLRSLVAAASVAALTVATAGAVLLPAEAVPPTTRTVKDAVEPDKAYDITAVTLRAAPRDDRPSVVLVRHGRDVRVGDSIDVWFDLDGDKTPDLHLVGDAFSEYAVFKTDSFTEDGKDISKKDCVRLAMAGSVSKVRVFPKCVGSPLSYAVSVRTSRFDKPDKADDWAPAKQRFTRKVLTAPLS